MISSIPYIGEILSFVTAIVWAMSVIFFKKAGESVHPVGLNLFKGLLSFMLIAPTMMLFGNELFRPAPAETYVLLLVSGIVGIGLADTLFFKCLNLLGAGLSAIVDCLYSPFIIGLSVLFLHETMSGWQFFGVALIVVAVLTAANPRHSAHINRRDLILGVSLGVIAMAAIAISVVMIKPILDAEPLLWVTQVRTFGGLVSLFVALIFFPARRQILKSAISVRNWKFMLPGSFLGNYVALMLWLGGMKYTQASTAAALNQTSNVFIFIFAAIFLKEMMTREKTIGIILALTGVFLVMFA